jgi:hypothetical protein
MPLPPLPTPHYHCRCRDGQVALLDAGRVATATSLPTGQCATSQKNILLTAF